MRALILIVFVVVVGLAGSGESQSCESMSGDGCSTCAANAGGIECGWCNSTTECIRVVPAAGGGVFGNCSESFIIEAPFCDPDYVEPEDSPKSTEDQLRDWFSDNFIYIIIGILVLCCCICSCIVWSCIKNKKKSKKKKKQAKDDFNKDKDGKSKKKKKGGMTDAQRAALASVAKPSAGEAKLEDVTMQDMTAQDMVDDLMDQDESMFL